MKQVETIKSIVLFLLIALSITLTFSIWTYTPNLQTIDQKPTVDISISNRATIEKVIKPYKSIFRIQDSLTGTTDSTEIEHILKAMENWTITDILKDQNFNADKLNLLMKKRNSFTLFYHAEVPLRVYENLMDIDDENIPETSFDRIIVEWNTLNTTLDMHFVSSLHQSRYSAQVHVADLQKFNQSLLVRGKNFSEYAEVATSDEHLIMIPVNRSEIIRNTYYQDSISPSRFRDALFSDPNAVRRSQVGQNQEEFQDDHALMTINTDKKILEYVQPTAKTNEVAFPSDLLLDVFDFINEHGGWSNEYRLTNMNPLSRTVEFQLHVHGLPVFSDTTSTMIEQVWGDERVFRYKRPYYILDSNLPSETETVYLASGVDVAKMLIESDEIDGGQVEEIIPGYFMKYDTNPNLFMLEPSWFYKIKGNWIRFSPENLGGEMIGLE
ncbi:YycH family regulatory protein [Sporosarcina jiandibaonis]|uniref:YycH family regulatory protein n=1 Tax=Sporosarcina jiandibaonis TaxID=2715535 RepID=UPI001552E34C|nr:two-component system activity regulator YycH [Sporosarcina jiandibaonis]